jgi:hypothetical protein
VKVGAGIAGSLASRHGGVSAFSNAHAMPASDWRPGTWRP